MINSSSKSKTFFKGWVNQICTTSRNTPTINAVGNTLAYCVRDANASLGGGRRRVTLRLVRNAASSNPLLPVTKTRPNIRNDTQNPSPMSDKGGGRTWRNAPPARLPPPPTCTWLVDREREMRNQLSIDHPPQRARCFQWHWSRCRRRRLSLATVDSARRVHPSAPRAPLIVSFLWHYPCWKFLVHSLFFLVAIIWVPALTTAICCVCSRRWNDSSQRVSTLSLSFKEIDSILHFSLKSTKFAHFFNFELTKFCTLVEFLSSTAR